ncbi:helix-turn-helix transcriptional regulator [Nocardia cyriacigeorgica]|uniref:Helix-turn-helix transcriptional regulator n=1 Tax=Nocardia cyriacigeorgica TaxID=135487 RepID=A0A5R8PDR4_9NOCA|nr:helix-turn-helix transcriptional regulator [Nocardia cyriacigeorgica]TLG09461.1 helix-turn-helix transcriptional regulator [Nocardia cyriacigeorgica]
MSISAIKNDNTLGQIVRARREELRMNRAMVAERSGLSPSTITRLEQGSYTKPTPDTLRAIATALDLTADELFIVTGWLTALPMPSKAFVRVICQGVGVNTVREIDSALREISRRRGNSLAYTVHTTDREPPPDVTDLIG